MSSAIGDSKFCKLHNMLSTHPVSACKINVTYGYYLVPVKKYLLNKTNLYDYY